MECTIGEGWAIVKDEAAHEKALSLAKGAYQEALLCGHEALSGSTLRGKALDYKARYLRSAQNLLSRLTEAGIKWGETRGNKGKRILVIG